METCKNSLNATLLTTYQSHKIKLLSTFLWQITHPHAGARFYRDNGLLSALLFYRVKHYGFTLPVSRWQNSEDHYVWKTAHHDILCQYWAADRLEGGLAHFALSDCLLSDCHHLSRQHRNGFVTDKWKFRVVESRIWFCKQPVFRKLLPVWSYQ